LLAELVSLYLRQCLGVSPRPRRFARGARERPRATALARAQAAAGLGHVATVRHLPMGLDAFAQRLVGYLDGSRTQAQIIDTLTRDILDGRLTIEGAGGDRGVVRDAVGANAERLLDVFARHGVLMPET
jgi:hypothetical protein